MMYDIVLLSRFFFNDTATTELYTLSLHDALPISTTTSLVFTSRTPSSPHSFSRCSATSRSIGFMASTTAKRDRKSTRLNSSHITISYAVFCLKKKNQRKKPDASPMLPVPYQNNAI